MAIEDLIKRYTDDIPNLKAQIQKLQSMLQISDIHQIDQSTPEGRLLFSALAELTTKTYPDKTPYQVLAKLNDHARKMDWDHAERNKLSDKQHKEKVTAEENIKHYINGFEQSAGRVVSSVDIIGVPSFDPTKPRHITSIRLNLEQL